VLFARFLMNANHLGWLRGIQRLDLVGSPDSLATDDEVIFAAELRVNLGDRGSHAARIFFVAKIKERFCHKRSGVQGRTWPDGGF
jgi:hypothetical protein